MLDIFIPLSERGLTEIEDKYKERSSAGTPREEERDSDRQKD